MSNWKGSGSSPERKRGSAHVARGGLDPEKRISRRRGEKKIIIGEKR